MKNILGAPARIRDATDDLLLELEGSSIPHTILKTIRAVIEPRASHLLRITGKA